jgi:hypothetical protein
MGEDFDRPLIPGRRAHWPANGSTSYHDRPARRGPTNPLKAGLDIAALEFIPGRQAPYAGHTPQTRSRGRGALG